MKRLTIIFFVVLLAVCLLGLCVSANTIGSTNTTNQSASLNDRLSTAGSTVSRYHAINKTTEGIEEYKGFIRSKNSDLEKGRSKSLLATITFSDYLTFEELECYIASYAVDAKVLQLRAVNTDGEIVTIYTRTDLGLEETFRLIVEQNKEEGNTLTGITAMYSIIDSKTLSNLENDSLTYLVDTSGDDYFWDDAQLQTHNYTTADKSNISFDQFPHSLVWDLEQLGIMK